MRHSFGTAAPQQHQPAGHAGTRRNGTAAECGQLTGIFLDVHYSKRGAKNANGIGRKPRTKPYLKMTTYSASLMESR